MSEWERGRVRRGAISWRFGKNAYFSEQVKSLKTLIKIKLTILDYECLLR